MIKPRLYYRVGRGGIKDTIQITSCFICSGKLAGYLIGENRGVTFRVPVCNKCGRLLSVKWVFMPL